MKVYPLAVYTADHGLAWNYPRGEINFSELDACRKAFGPLPDFDAGAKGFCGVWANGDKVFAMRCRSVDAWDFRGRSATYLSVTWLPRSEAANVDFEKLLESDALKIPTKAPQPFFEVEASAHNSPISTVEPMLNDGFMRAGAIIAGQSAGSIIAIKRADGNRQATCVISAPFSASPMFGKADTLKVASNPKSPAASAISPLLVVTIVAWFLTAAIAAVLGMKWWTVEKSLKAEHAEVEKLTEKTKTLDAEIKRLREAADSCIGPRFEAEPRMIHLEMRSVGPLFMPHVFWY